MTIGGSRHIEEKAFAVIEWGCPSSSSVVITVTPVANWAKADLNSSLSNKTIPTLAVIQRESQYYIRSIIRLPATVGSGVWDEATGQSDGWPASVALGVQLDHGSLRHQALE